MELKALSGLLEAPIGTLYRMLEDSGYVVGLSGDLEEEVLTVYARYCDYGETVVRSPDGSSVIPFTKFGCVYFLLRGECVVYVGQTMHLSARISQHVGDGKVFDGVSYFEVDREDLVIIEAVNIAHHLPELNIENLEPYRIFQKVLKQRR